MKKILIATNFSPESRNATDYVLQLYAACKERIEIVFMNVYLSPMIMEDMVPSVNEILEEETEKMLNEEIKRFRNKYPHQDLTFGKRLYTGTLESVLDLLTQSAAYDLLVLGTEDLKGFQKGFSHSVSAVDDVHCPLLIVPGRVKKPELNFIALGLDYQVPDNSYIDKLKNLKELCELHEASVMIVNVQDHDKDEEEWATEGEIKEHLHEKLGGIPHKFYFTNHKEVAKGLDHFVQLYKAGMLVMISQERSWLERIFHHSDTKEMAANTHIPLLIL